MSSGRPLVSIGMPIYNEGRFIAKTLEGVLAQDYENFELIISDNASTDETERICTEFAARDERIRYSRNETNSGAHENFRKVLELSRGDYFAWASGHDVWRPAFISRCLEALLERESVVVAYPQAQWIDAQGEPLEVVHNRLDTRGLNHRLARFNTVIWGFANQFAIYGLFRKSALKKSQPCLHVFAWDFVLLAELSLIGDFAHVPEPLYLPRKLEDHGDVGALIAKIESKERKLARWDGQKLYWGMFGAIFRAARRHCYGYAEVFNSMLVLTLCMTTKHRWIWARLANFK